MEDTRVLLWTVGAINEALEMRMRCLNRVPSPEIRVFPTHTRLAETVSSTRRVGHLIRDMGHAPTRRVPPWTR